MDGEGVGVEGVSREDLVDSGRGGRVRGGGEGGRLDEDADLNGEEWGVSLLEGCGK